MGDCNILIIGAGPAGLTAAIYAGRAACEVTLLEKSFPGGQVSTTAAIANYPGFPEEIDGIDLAERLRAQAEKFGVTFTSGEATRIEKNPDGRFTITTQTGEKYQSTAVIVATGATPRQLGAPGEAELRGRGVSYCGTCDGPFFKGKRLAVIGGGDSAMKEALHLTKFASHVTMIVRKPVFSGTESIYKREIAANPKMTVLFQTQVKEVLGTSKVESLTLEKDGGKKENFPVDGVFIFIGTIPNTEFLADIVGQLRHGLVDVDHDMMTAIPGLFAAGEIRVGSYRQIATAVGDGATAAMAAEQYLRSRG